MGKKENKRIAKKFFEAINANDLGLADPYYGEGYEYRAPGTSGVFNKEQSQAYVEGFIKAFPDLHFDIVHEIAQGDFVVVNWIAKGTHAGPLMTPTGDSLPPTGKSASVPGSSTYKFKDGKAVGSWVHWDMVTLLAQLGLMPVGSV